jgi:hypothetical protein
MGRTHRLVDGETLDARHGGDRRPGSFAVDQE